MSSGPTWMAPSHPPETERTDSPNPGTCVPPSPFVVSKPLLSTACPESPHPSVGRYSELPCLRQNSQKYRHIIGAQETPSLSDKGILLAPDSRTTPFLHLSPQPHRPCPPHRLPLSPCLALSWAHLSPWPSVRESQPPRPLGILQLHGKWDRGHHPPEIKEGQRLPVLGHVTVSGITPGYLTPVLPIPGISCPSRDYTWEKGSPAHPGARELRNTQLCCF